MSEDREQDRGNADAPQWARILDYGLAIGFVVLVVAAAIRNLS